MNPPNKKLQDFCKLFKITWQQLDIIVMSADNVELDVLNTGEYADKQLVIDKYLYDLIYYTL